MTGDGGAGSGTLLLSDGDGKELVLTARHVISRNEPVSIRWKGQKYPARFVRACKNGDMSVIETDVPGTVRTLELSPTAPATARVYGYGQSRRLHQHEMRYIGQIYGEADDIYSRGGNEGDSGAGVFTPDGKLCGVFVAYENQTHNSVVVSARVLCNFLGSQAQAQSGSGRSRLIIFPFVWWGRQWNNGPGAVPDPTPQPVVVNPEPPSGVSVNAPGVGVQVGAVGPQGPAGPPGPVGAPGVPGPPGASAPGVDLSGLLARMKALESAMTSLTSMTEKTANAVQRPITFNAVAADGSVQTGQAQLGSTVNMDLGVQNLQTRLAALEARMVPTPPTPRK
jgi:hypothetical protein